MLPRRPRILFVSQVFPPDPASVGQHMVGAADELVRRGFDVLVLTSDRGYDDSSRRYDSHGTTPAGARVRRLPFSSFGKRLLPLRFIAAWLFVLQCAVRGLLMRGLSGVVISTSPPMSPCAGILINALRRVPVTFWVMDLNIDLLVAMGNASPRSPLVRLFGWMDRAMLRRAGRVVALDTMMAARLKEKWPEVTEKLAVIPPWPLEDHLAPVPHAENPFRREQGFEGKFVIMFSGNLTIAADVDTLLEASRELTDLPNLLFVFIGGGSGKRRVNDFIERNRPPNVVSLPYQPLEKLRYSLSAGDVHLVSVGDMLPGLSHPCKVYGAMAVARPILLLGPRECHVAHIISRDEIGWQVRHGDVKGAVRTVREMVATDPRVLQDMGVRARRAMTERFAQPLLCGRFCDEVEASMSAGPFRQARTLHG